MAALEGLAFLALAVAELVAAGSGRVGGAVAATLFFAVCAAGLLWCARGLAVRAAWSRGPLVAAQLLLLAVSWSYHRPYPLTAALVAVVAALALAAMLLPSTTRALSGPPKRSQ